MSAVPQETASAHDVILCPQCAQENPPEEIYCVACGAALGDVPADSSLELLATGTVLADLYRIDKAESYGREHRYHAGRQGAAGGPIHSRERASEEAEALRFLAEPTSGFAHLAMLFPEQLVEQEARVYLVCPEISGIR